MITVRTFASPIEAGLAKSILDDYGIFSVLIDQDMNRYSGAPFAVPVRLQVQEDEAERANHILSDDLEAAASIDHEWENAAESPSIFRKEAVSSQNPWELLAVALVLLLPAIAVLQTKYPTVTRISSRVRREVAAVTIMHFLSWLAIIFAAVLIALYFQIRRSSRAIQEKNSTI